MTQDMVKMMSQDKMIGKREILFSSPSPRFSRFLRTMLLLLIMTLGAGEMWGQPETGYYRLKSCKQGGKNWYYMCPATENNQFLGDGKPFLTTHQLDESNNLSFIWLVQKTGDYYYIIHHEGDKDMYITTNDAPESNTTGDHRRRLHLEEIGTPGGEQYLFKIGYEYDGGANSKYNIWNKVLTVKIGNDVHKYLSISGDHNNNYGSPDNGDRGMIGLYSKSNDTGVQWQFEPYSKCLPPVITCEDGSVSIGCATEDCTIYYTTNNYDPDPTDASQRYDNTPFTIDSETTVKAIAVKDEYENSKIVSKTITQVEAPTIAFDHTTKTITLSPTTEGVDYYYTTAEGTDAPDNPTKTTGTQYSADSGIAFSDNSITTINVIAFEDGKVPSASTTKTIIYMPDITLEGGPYTYDGTEKTPSISSMKVGETTVSDSDYGTPIYENNINAGTGTATVTIRESATSDYIIYGTKEFGINKAPLTVIANAHIISYGEAPANNGVTYGEDNGTTNYFVNSETESVLEGELTYSYNYSQNDNAGSYTITPSGLTATNYDITFVPGTLTVNPAGVTLTANSRDTDVYDGTEKTVTGFTCKVGEQTVEGLTFEGVSASGSGTDAGDYDVTFTGVTANETKDETGNYVVAGTTNGKLTIKPAGVTLIADSKNTDVYDGTEKTVTGFTCKMGEQTVDGLTFGESVTASGSGTDAGDYDVTFTGVTVTETKDNTGNYVVTAITNGTLTINPKDVTISGITAENKVYDGYTTATLVFTGITITGKLDGDNLTVTATGAFPDKNVGTDKTVNISGLALDGTDRENYQLATSGQQETTKANITTAPATVTAENKTKGYGDADPAFTWTVDGLLGTDTKDVLTVNISRETGEDVRTTPYKITPAGEETQGNYKVTYVEGTLIITSKAIGDGNNPAEGIDIDITTYDGTNYTVTVKQGENTLQEGVDNAYTWTGADGSTDTYVVTITGQGNYNNSAKATYIKQTFYDTTPDQVLTTETTAAVYCATQNLKVNDTFEAYYVTKLENNSLTITKVEAGEGENKKNYIPEGQPVLLISETNPAPKGFTLKPYTGTGTDLVTIPETGEGANLLKVVTDDGGREVNLAEVYMFSMGEFVLTKAGTMSKGKFYLENPDYNTSAHSRSVLSITSGDVTGIHTSQLSDTDSQIPDIWYTIGGQKLHKKPTRKGIYLHNGKKVVIK